MAVAAACGDSCCCDPNDPKCKTPPPPPGAASIQFGPLPDVVHCADDIDANTPGVQVNVRVELVNDDGSGYDSVTVTNTFDGSSSEANFDANGEATVAVTLTGAADPGADNTLTAVASNGDAAKDLTDTDTIRDDCVQAETVTCAFVAPVDGATLTSTPATVSVTCSTSPGIDQAVVALVNSGDVLVSATPDNVGSAATSAQISLVNGAGSGALPLPSDTGATLDLLLLDPTNLLATPATATVHVSLAIGNVLTFVSPIDGTNYTDADDTDGNALNGITIPLDVTADVASDVVFDVTCDSDDDPTNGNNHVTGTSDAGDVTLTPDGGRVHIEGQLTNLVFPNCTMLLTVDGVVSTVNFTVTSTAPTFAIVLDPVGSGTDGAYVAADDNDTSTADTFDFTATITPAGDVAGLTGTVSLLEVATSTSVTLQSGVDLSAPFTVSFTIPFSEAADWQLQVTATNGTITTSPITRDIFIDTVAPSVGFFSPNEGLSLNASNDADPNTTGFQARIILVVSAGTVSCSVNVDGTDAAGSISGTSCIAVVTITDGSHALSGTAVDAAGNTTTGGPINFSSDSSIPTVQSILVVNAGADNTLNAGDNGAEAAGNVTSDVTATFSSDMNGQSVTLTGPGGAKSATVSGGTATFTAFVLNQGDNELVVTGADGGGNALDATTTHLVVTVDTVSPVVTIEAPAAGSLNAADDADPAASGFQADVVVASDAGDGRAVQVLIDGANGTTANLSAGSVTIRITLPEGNHSITAVAADAAQNSTTSAAVAVAVDSLAPVLQLVASNATTTDDLDGNPVNGVQVNVTVTPTGLTAGRPITITSDVQGTINANGFACNSAGDGVAVQCRVTYLAEGQHVVVATATDEAGNLGTSNTRTVSVVTGLFFVSITNPPLRAGFRSIGTAEDENAGTAGAQVGVVGTTDAPAGSIVEVLINGVPASTTCTVDGAGGLSCTPFTLNDNTTGTFEVTLQSGIKTGTSGQDSFRVDLGRPTTSFTSPAAATATFNKASDLQQGVAGLQVQVTVDVTECENGVLRILDGATSIGTANVDATGNGSVNVTVSDSAEGDAETWTATCTDSEGNTPAAPDTFTAKVDITSPGAPTLNLAVLDLRSGNVAVSYSQPGDNNFAAAPPTSVQIFFSKTPIDDVSFGQARQIAVPNVSQTAAGGTTQLVDTSATPLAFDNTWFAALRATDDVGNRSTLATAQITLATNNLTLGPPTGVSGWAQALSRSRGDINGDGIDDIVVGAPDEFSAGRGGFEVILGGATGNALQRTFVTPPTSMPCAAGACTPLEVGWAVNILSSIDGDAFDDVVVVGYDSNFDHEFLLIYRGTANGIAANAAPSSVLEIANPFAPPAFRTFAGFDAQSLGDLDGDGSVDWGFTAPELGIAYVFLNSGTLPATGSVDDAVTTEITNSDFNNFFFFASGIAGGGANGDGFDDLVISCRSPTAALFVVRGRASWPATIDVVGASGNDFVAISKPANQSPGFDLSSGDVDGDGDLDVVYLALDGVTVVTNTGATWAGEVTFAASPQLVDGSGLAVASVNGDARADMLVGGVSPASVFFGASPPVAKTADASYGITAGSESDYLQFSAANVVGSSAEPDVIISNSTGAGSVTIRF